MIAAKNNHSRKVGQYRFVFRASAILSLLLSLVLVIIAMQVSSLAVPLSILRVGSETILQVGIGMALVSLILTLFPSRLAISILTLQLATFMAFSLSSGEESKGDREVHLFGKDRIWLNSVDWHEVYTEPDPELAHRGLRNSQARVHHRDFDVTYRLGPDGYRIMPVPKDFKSGPTIVFLGCSMTFGAGCFNEEIFPWLLAERAWPHYQVKNWSVSGWGTTHMGINIDNALALDPKPALILYGFIADHLKRNSRRKSWHAQSQYIVFNESGVFEGVAPGGQGTLPDSPELREKEETITKAILKRANEKCRAAGVPLVVLYLDDRDMFGEGRSARVLEIPGLEVLDLRHSFTEVYPSDFHLTPLGHQILARAIARDETLARLSGLADLHQPKAFPDTFPGERDFRPSLLADKSPEQHRRVEFESTDRSLLVKKIESHGAGEEEIAFGRVIPPMKRGQIAIVFFQAASATDRPLAVLLNRFVMAGQPVGRVDDFTTGQHLVRCYFPTEEDLLYPRILIRCGGDDSPFEIRDFQVDVVDELPTGFDWLRVFTRQAKAKFKIRQGSAGERIARVDNLHMDKPENWRIQYQVLATPVNQARMYRVKCLARSDRPKMIPVAIQKDPKTGVVISDFQGLQTTEEWKEQELFFHATADSTAGIICFTLGEDTTPVEFQQVLMEEIGRAGE